MDVLYIGTGYCTVNMYIVLCYFINIITSEPCVSNATDTNLPPNWPCQWNDGIIPFVFNFYSLSGLRRLTSLVRKGHSHLEERSCLVFKEHNPVDLVKRKNYTYLFYSYSGVLENCCLPFFSKPVGRRLILITPTCTLPAEVAHATLHGLGLVHKKHQPFSEDLSEHLLFHATACPGQGKKLNMFNKA